MTGRPWTLLRRIQVPKPLPKASAAKKAEATNVRQSARLPVTKKIAEDPYLPSGSLFEARLHATVDMTKKSRVHKADEQGTTSRPRAREIPLGEKRVNRKDKGRALMMEGPSKEVEEPVQRARPSFRSPVRLQQAEPEAPVASTSAHVYVKPSFRRSYSTQAGEQSENSKETLEAWKVQRAEPVKRRKPVNSMPRTPKRKLTIPPKLTVAGAGLPDPEPPLNTPDLVGILRYTCKYTPPTPELLKHLIRYHNASREYVATASYNVLLELSLRVADIRSQNYLLHQMGHEDIPFDVTTWDIYMQGLALEGRWSQLAEAYEERQRAGASMTKIGWTRIVQAATRNGKTSMAKDDDRDQMSPIYSAVYTLPKGVRQLQLEYFSRPINPDVDHLLAAIMPADAIPMDFQATIAVAHRLAKQRRWQEASEIADIWLDRSQYDPDPASVKDPIADQCTTLLHVIMEGLVIDRAEPADILAFVDGYLEKYSTFRPKPSFHTLFLLLHSYRSMPVSRRFAEAAQTYTEFCQAYDLTVKSPLDLYGDAKCRRQLQSYGLWTLRNIAQVAQPEQRLALQVSTRSRLASLKVDLAAIADVITNGVSTINGSGKETRKRISPDLEAKLRRERLKCLAHIGRHKQVNAVLRRRDAIHAKDEKMRQDSTASVNNSPDQVGD